MPARLAQAGLVGFDDVLAAGRPRPAGIEVVTRVRDTDPGRGARRRALVTALEEAGGTLPAADLLDRAGATRAVLAMVRFEWLEAIRVNPLATVGVAGLLAAGLAAPFWIRAGGRIPVLTRGARLGALWTVVAAAAANWIYLALSNG